MADTLFAASAIIVLITVSPIPSKDNVSSIGTVNLFGRGHQAPGYGKSAAYIVSATLEISAQTRNVCILAALCSAAVT